MDVSKLGFYSKEGHILLRSSVRGLSELCNATRFSGASSPDDDAAAVAARAEPDPALQTTATGPLESGTRFPAHRAGAGQDLDETATGVREPRPNTERSGVEDTASQEVSDALFKQAVERRCWVLVLTLVQLGVSVHVRDEVFVQAEEWRLFADAVRCGLRQAIPTAAKARVREFALEKALLAGREDLVQQLLAERKLKAQALRQLARRVARGLPAAALTLLTGLSLPRFTQHVWEQATQERQWAVITGHAQRLIQDRNVEDQHVLALCKKRAGVHHTFCSRHGPLLVHSSRRCVVYEAVVMQAMGRVVSELFALGDSFPITSTRQKRDFEALCLCCQNREFFLDFFHECLRKAVAKDYDRLYRFLLKQLPLALVDSSKKSSCEIVLKSLLSAAESRKVKYEAYRWLNQLKTFPKYMSELVEVVFENKDWLKLLPALVAFLSQNTLLLPDFLWLYLRALLTRRASLARYVPAVNTVLKMVTVGTQTPLLLALHRLAMAEQIYGQQTAARVTAWPESEASSAMASGSEDSEGGSHSWSSLPEHAWRAGHKRLVAFTGPWLLHWCRERSYANVAFLLALLLKHAGCAVDWKAVAAMATGEVSDYLLLEGVSYAALDGSCGAAARLLGRCSWSGATLKACPHTLYALFLPDHRHVLALLTAACRYARLSGWAVFLTYAQLRHGQQWRRSYQLLANLPRLDPVLLEEVCTDAVSRGHWDTFASLARSHSGKMGAWGQRSAPTMSRLLKTALHSGQVQGVAAALSLVDLYTLPNFLQPRELLVAALQSPHPERMARACIAAGASVLHRKMEGCGNGSPAKPCAMTTALVMGKRSLVSLLHRSGACSNARLFQLDSALAASNGTLHSTAVPADCRALIRAAASSPPPLARLAGFALSALLGLHPGRARRVQGCFGPRVPCPAYAKHEMCYAQF